MECKISRWQLLKKLLNNMSPDEFVRELGQRDDVELIDVRTPGEYGAWHLKGARNMDYLGDNFLEELDKLDPDKTYFVYCRTGRRSVRCCTLMRNAGFEHVFHLTNGLAEWEPDPALLAGQAT